MPKEYQVNTKEIKDEKECSTCKKGLNIGQKGTIILSFFMLGTSIYGTVKLIQLLMASFQ